MNPDKYDLPVCWQKHIKDIVLEEDLSILGKDKEWADSLRVKDFEFKPIQLKGNFEKIKNFILRYEWLKKMPGSTSHCFIVEYNGILAGVLLIGIPYGYSGQLSNSKELERTILRGACISWSPKNLASFLIMSSIRWMVQNTQYRYFTSYADPEAKELGTVYQACNFLYLGRKKGKEVSYLDPKRPDLGWTSPRTFRRRRYYIRFAEEIGIEWKKEWNKKPWGINWHLIPPEISKRIKDHVKTFLKSMEKKIKKHKHKYVYILGKDSRETKYLYNQFLEHNKTKRRLIKPYPKNRGD